MDPTIYMQLLEFADKMTATAVLVIIIYLFVTGRIVARGTIAQVVDEYDLKINGGGDDE